MDDPKQASATLPRTKTQIAAAILKPKQKLDVAKSKVEEKVAGRPKSKAESHVQAPAAPAVAPEQTQADVELKRPTYERVETQKADGVPHVSPAAAAQAEADAARAKRAVPVLAKESSRDKAIDAATPLPVAEPITNGGSDVLDHSAPRPLESTPDLQPEAGNLPASAAAPDDVPETVSADAEQSKPSAHAVAASASTEKTANLPPEDVPKADKIVTETVHTPVEPGPSQNALEQAADPPSLKSQNTEILPPTETAGAGAADAPGPALNAGEEVIQEAKAEVAQREQERHDNQGHPKESLTEAVAHVH